MMLTVGVPCEPPALLERRVEAAILDHVNPRVLDGHVAAAAFEAPVDDDDRATLGEAAISRAPHVSDLRRTSRGWVYAGKGYPAAATPLYSPTTLPNPLGSTRYWVVWPLWVSAVR